MAERKYEKYILTARFCFSLSQLPPGILKMVSLKQRTEHRYNTLVFRAT
jgi:hypothetical protein